MSSKNVRRHTKPCVYFQKNQCPLAADACDYAHVLVPLDELEGLKPPQATLRTKPCRFYLGGQCKEGYFCRFKHPASAQSLRGSSSVPASASDITQGAGFEELSISEGEYGDDDLDVRELEPDRKAKPEEHPRYRSMQSHQNYLLGKCVYGDHCSYQHAGSPTGYASSSSSPPPHAHALAGNVPSAANAFPLSLPPAAVPGARHLPSSSPSLSLAPEDGATPAALGDAFAVRVLPSGLPAYPPMYSPVPMPRPAPGHAHSSPPPPTPPYAMYAAHPHSMPMALGIMHVPVAVPMYQQQPPRVPRQQNERRDTRPMSSSSQDWAKPKPSMPSRNDLLKTQYCKFYTETGTCAKGDNCNYMHDKMGALAASSPVKERLERRRSSIASGSSSETGPESTARKQTVEDEKAGGFHKINWRVVGGGVMIGGDYNRRRQDEVATEEDVSSSRTPTNSKRSSPTDQDARQRSVVKSSGSPVDPPSVIHLGSPSSSASGLQPSGVVDWSDDYDEIIVSPDEPGTPSGMTRAVSHLHAAQVWRTRSSPSSPLHAHSGVPNLFPAESP